jgi:hypothetical protein
MVGWGLKQPPTLHRLWEMVVMMVVKSRETNHPRKRAFWATSGGAVEIYYRQPRFQAAPPLRWVIFGPPATGLAANGRCVPTLKVDQKSCCSVSKIYCPTNPPYFYFSGALFATTSAPAPCHQKPFCLLF